VEATLVWVGARKGMHVSTPSQTVCPFVSANDGSIDERECKDNLTCSTL